MNYGLPTHDRHNFLTLRPFGTFNSDLEREFYEESTPVNNRKMIATGFLHIFTWPFIFSTCVLPLKIMMVELTAMLQIPCLILQQFDGSSPPR
jgi:hypothetical protein